MSSADARGARPYHNNKQYNQTRKKIMKFTFDSLANGNAPEAQITVYDDDRKPLVLGVAHHFMANRWGNSGNSVRLYFSGLQDHYRW